MALQKNIGAAIAIHVRLFEIWTPMQDMDEIVDISEHVEAKRAAILAYRSQCEVLAFDESDPRIKRIRANLLVERESQKRIVVGQGGQQIKAIGIRARQGIERFTGSRIHLELFVKVDPHWSKSARRLAELGYH